ncbi:hypothetical protein [Mycolicibacterium sp. XJ1819]
MATSHKRHTSDVGRGRSKRSRLKGLSLGEAAISVLIIGILAISLLSTLPKSLIKEAVAPVLIPVARSAGLDQNWAMFAPNPPRTFSKLEVHVIMRDGEDRVWRPEDDKSMPDIYWRKVKEEIVKRKEFRPGLASWVIRNQVKPNERPARVVMIVTTETLPLPGQGEPKITKRVVFDQKLASAASGARTS